MLGKELVIGGNFSSWPGDDPDGWTVIGESGTDPEISEVGAGQGHGGVGTGFCNLYTSDGTDVQIRQTLTLVVGRKYRLSINFNTITVGKIKITEPFAGMWPGFFSDATGIRTVTFVATETAARIQIARQSPGDAADVTFDDISIREDIPTGLSRTGHSFASRQEI